MRSLQIILLASLATSTELSNRQIQCSGPDTHLCLQEQSTYINSICNPKNSSDGHLDFDAPCNAITAIKYQCIWGAAGYNAVTSNTGGSLDTLENGGTAAFSNISQQVCICQSQFFDQWQGCEDCIEAHGAAKWETTYGSSAWVPKSVIQSFSSSYCAANATPSVGFAHAQLSAVAKYASTRSRASVSFSDPVGTLTAVSWYFKPKITGSQAWVLAQATETVSSGASTETTVSGSAATSGGQIVATTPPQPPAPVTTRASTSSSGIAGQETAALAGVIAVAGFAFLL